MTDDHYKVIAGILICLDKSFKTIEAFHSAFCDFDYKSHQIG